MDKEQIAYHKGQADECARILSIIDGYICSFEPTIRFRDWLRKEIKESA